MKDIRPALRAFLLGDVSIAAVVGGDRVFHNVIPQGVSNSCIVFTRVSGRSGHHMAGRDGLSFTRIQIDAWANDQDSATSLGNLVKDRLDGFRGTMGAGESAASVQGAFFQDEREDYNDASRLHRMSRDYVISFEEV